MTSLLHHDLNLSNCHRRLRSRARGIPLSTAFLSTAAPRRGMRGGLASRFTTDMHRLYCTSPHLLRWSMKEGHSPHRVYQTQLRSKKRTGIHSMYPTLINNTQHHPLSKQSPSNSTKDEGYAYPDSHCSHHQPDCQNGVSSCHQGREGDEASGSSRRVC